MAAIKTCTNYWQYRHTLEHRMPQSLDYAELYSAFERRPEPIVKDGQIIGTCGYIGSRPVNPDWRFDDLYNTTVAVYEYYLELLERLNKLPTFKRPV